MNALLFRPFNCCFYLKIATEDEIPMRVVADAALYAGLKMLGRLD